jgi:hypothetical protein
MHSTFRFKISIGAALLVIAITIVVYLLTVLPMSSRATKGIEDAVHRASTLVTQNQKLNAYELVNLAEQFTRDRKFIHGVQTETEKQRRINVYDALMLLDKKLREEGRKPDFIGVLDRNGAIIARDLDPNNMYGEKLSYLNIKQALRGSSSMDVWRMKNKMMRAAAAPIIQNGKVLGVVALAYEITAREARDGRDQMGTQVAFFMNNQILASSFTIAGQEDSEDSQKTEDLAKKLLGSAESPGQTALADNKVSEMFEVTLLGETYAAMTGPMPVRLTNKKVGYVVLDSITAAKRTVKRVRWMILLMGLFTLVLVLGAMWVVSRHFVDAEDKLELGVAEIISGNMEYTFDAVEEFEGLANAINVMLARLLGRPEPGEEDDEETSWRSDVLFIDAVTGDIGAEAQKAQQLITEHEETYFARVHREYVMARQQSNLPVDGITLESLTQKLKANEAMLRAKHECSAVRFEVRSAAGKVSLKPIRIK